jgi:hypothetical protein
MSEKFKYVNRTQAKRVTGISYIGSVNSSSKIMKGAKYNVETLVVYLAPNNMSGFQVCPGATPECKAACLNESGRNGVLGARENKINKARIAKTKLFHENKAFFMAWLVDEITAAKAKAEKAGKEFTVRFNGTSDLSPYALLHEGKNILQLFPDVQFYDYTKVLNRIHVTEKYSNYDLTYSFSGRNWNECKIALENNVRVAVVFENELPKTFNGYQVVNGDKYDMRYLDPKQCIVGLKFKKVRNTIDFETNKFIISHGDSRCEY